MINSQLLEEELAQPQYADQTDEQILEALNAQSIEYFIEPATPELTNFLMNTGLYAKLLATYRNPEVPLQIQVAAESGLDLAQSQIPHVNLQNDNIQMMLGALVQAGVWTQEEVDSVLNFGRRYRSRASQLFDANVTQIDLNIMRLRERAQEARQNQQEASNQAAFWHNVAEQLEAGIDPIVPEPEAESVDDGGDE